MSKVALLIGVSTYPSGFSPLPSAIRDGEAMQAVLQSAEIGKFDDTKLITDPDPLQMQEAIETLFSERKRDDLVLLFFSGHGVKDSSGKLYLATALTKKTERGDVVKSTAVPASFIHDVMKDSRSKRKVIILDCCFSGAFAHGLSAKDDGTVDLKSQLGGEGCAVLTSSSSIQYSFEQQGEELSVYTRYLVEGMQTGAADLGNDGYISVDELHEYAQSKVHEESPSMNPKIYVVEEGYKIQVLEAVAPDPLLKYQRAVEQCAVAGEISQVWRITLDEMQANLQLSADEADLVETRVLRPYREYRKKLQRYESAFKTAIQRGFPIKESVRAALKQLQRTLALRNEDILMIEEKWGKRAESKFSNSSSVRQMQNISQSILTSSLSSAEDPVSKSVQSNPKKQVASQQESSNMSSIRNTPLIVGVSAALIAALSVVYIAPRWFGKPQTVDQFEIPTQSNGSSGSGIVDQSPDHNSEGISQPTPSEIVSQERPLQDILYGSAEQLNSEECKKLGNAYSNGNAEVISVLTEDPDTTLLGEKCTELGAKIDAQRINSLNEATNSPEGVDSPQVRTACIFAEGNLRLYTSPGAERNDIGVAPGEGVSVISTEPERARFGDDFIPFVEVRKADGSSGWIPEERIQQCP